MRKYELDPSALDSCGWTALHIAARYGRLGTIRHLVEKYNVDVRTRSGTNVYAWDWADREGQTEAAALLAELMTADAEEGTDLEASTAAIPDKL